MNEFKTIESFPLYRVNAQGQVFSTKSNKILSPWDKKSRKSIPYKYVSLKSGDIFKKVPVHRLVAMTYIGCVDGKVINHLDGNPSNNNLDNLEICTTKRNTVHGFDSGLNTNYGEKHYQGKLTLEKVKEILYLKGVNTQSVIAEKYGVCRQTISDIHRGVIWSRALANE